MARGGFPPGAGRRRGSKNSKPSKSVLIAAAAAAGGELPLDYMLRVMRDAATSEGRRDDMAKAAAPYLHARLAAVEHMGKGGGPIEFANARDKLSHLLDGEAAARDADEPPLTTH